jgi:hypothetical protein
MKRNFILNTVLVCVLLFAASCRDFVEPNIPYSEFDNGTYVRTIRTATASSVAPSLTFNFFNLSVGKFEATIEVVDNALGSSVDNVTIKVRHLRIGATGQVYTPLQPVLIRTIAGSEFTSNSESKFPRHTFSITAAQAVAACGLTFDQLDGGDFFDFSVELTDTKGRVFNADNASSDVRGGFFYDSPFFYRVGVVCPSNIVTGTEAWTASTVSNFGDFTSTVNVTKVGAIRYRISDVSAGLYAGFGFNAIQEGLYQDNCNTFVWVSAGDTQFSLAAPAGTGSYNPSTNTIVVPWFDSGNGIEGITTLVKP